MEKIYSAIASIMQNIGAIRKEQEAKKANGERLYKFRGIDAVLNALHPLFVEYKLFSISVVKNVDIATIGNTKRAVVNVDYVFTSAEDGSSITVSMTGEGMDSGDKAVNKALSAAYKYACFQLFCIPTEGDMCDSEKDNEHQKMQQLEKENEELKQKLGRKITEEEIIKLSNELIRTGYGADKILKREKIDSVEQLNYERYQFYMKNFEKTPDKPKK